MSEISMILAGLFFVVAIVVVFFMGDGDEH